MSTENNSELLDFLDGRGAAPAELQVPEGSQQAPPQDNPAQPPVEAPAAPPVQEQTNDTPPPAAPTFDLDAELAKISNGAIKGQSELSDVIARATKLSDFESRVQQLESENSQLKAKTEDNPFASDYVKRLNDLYKAGATTSQIEAFSTLNRIDNLDGLSAQEARLLSLQIKNGLSEEDAKIYLNSTYKLNPDEHDAETIRQEEIRLKVDSQADREFLKTHKAEVSKVPVSQAETAQQELAQRQTEHLTKLQPMVKSVVSDAVSLFKGISLNGKEGDQNIATDFTPSKESLDTLDGVVQKFVASNWEHLPANEKGVEQIKSFAHNILALANYKTWIANAASERETQVRAEYNNPTPINRNQNNPAPAKTGKDELDAKILAGYY